MIMYEKENYVPHYLGSKLIQYKILHRTVKIATGFYITMCKISNRGVITINNVVVHRQNCPNFVLSVGSKLSQLEIYKSETFIELYIVITLHPPNLIHTGGCRARVRMCQWGHSND
jgi:hypothetical protein